MTRAWLSRELQVVGRCPAFVISACLHVGVLSGFLLAWSGQQGVPLLEDRDFYQQTRAVQAMLLAILLPWTAARCVADERGDELVLLAAVTASRPSQLIFARAGGALIALGSITAMGIPVAVFAQRISGGPLLAVARDEAAMMALAVIASASVLAWRSICRSRLLGWLAAEASTLTLVVAAFQALPAFTVAAGAVGFVGGVTLLLMGARSDRSLLYLAEEGV